VSEGIEEKLSDVKIITGAISKTELASLVDHIVTPFYNRILADNRVRHFIKEEIFFGLKIKQTIFVYKILTRPVSELVDDFDAMNRTHGKVGLGLEPFVHYFEVWKELMLGWLQENKKLDANDLERWHLKMDTFFDYLRRTYPAPGHETPVAPGEEMPDLKAMVRHIHEEQVRNKIAAPDFLAGFDFDTTIIDELADVESETLDMLYKKSQLDQEVLKKVEKLLLDYALLLDNTYEFKELAFALSNLCEVLGRSHESATAAGTQKKVRLFLDGILSDLQRWRGNVFITRDALDVHYLDASLFSSIAQLDVLLTSSKCDAAEGETEELELF
jgi:hypothetical protein